MTTYGLTPEGFVPKTLEVIKGELEGDLQTAFGSSIDLDPDGALGQFVGLMSERFASLWELAQEVHSSYDPDNATGSTLEGISALTGTYREGATKSTVTETCIGTPGTVLTAGRVVSVVSVGTKFSTLASATILAVAAWQASTGYVVGQRVSNGGKVYQCITSGTSAGSGGPSGTGSNITDNTVHWKYLGTGTGAVDVACEAQETGPKVALAGTLTTIETPVGGWNAALNLLDADEGRDIESDAALRIRRADEVAGEGNAALNAIRADILRVEGVTACTVFGNTTMVTDADGVPPKAIEVLVLGGDDQAIAEALFATVGGGIETYGSTTCVVKDSAGNNQTVKFSRPTAKPVYIVADVVRILADFPSDGDTQIKEQLVAFGDKYPIGYDVYANALRSQIFSIAGVLNVTNCKIGLAPSPSAETTITITNRELATFDSSRITVNLSGGTP